MSHSELHRCDFCRSYKQSLHVISNGYDLRNVCKTCKDFFSEMINYMSLYKSIKAFRNIKSFVLSSSLTFKMKLETKKVRASRVITTSASKSPRKYCLFCGKKLGGIYIQIGSNNNMRMCRDCEHLYKKILEQTQRPNGCIMLSNGFYFTVDNVILATYLSKFKYRSSETNVRIW